MITALSWVPKGALKSVPSKADPLSKEEIEEMKKLVILENSVEIESDDEDMCVDASKQPAEIEQALGAANAIGKRDGGSNFPDIADGLDELNMDDYDNEDDAIDIFGSGIGDTFYPSNELDPYLKDANDDDSEELEDIVIKSEDAVVVCAHFVDEMSQLQIDESEPSLILGGVAEKKKKKKGKKVKKSIKYREDSHTGPVLALAWNKEYRNLLASGSVDKMVKIWDVATSKCKITMEHHTDKVQAIAWNHNEREVLLSGSFDHTVVMRDGRVPSHPGFKWSVDADVESLVWDPHDQHLFVASLENGTVVGFDIRTATFSSSSEPKPKFTLHAHDKAVCAISYNPLVPNLLATGSEDKMVKLWDLSNNQPSCIATQNPNAGAVFSLSFSEDCPFLLAIAGSKGKLALWDTILDAGISKRYGKYAKQNKSSAFK